jgi:hypothetical protein
MNESATVTAQHCGDLREIRTDNTKFCCCLRGYSSSRGINRRERPDPLENVFLTLNCPEVGKIIILQ